MAEKNVSGPEHDEGIASREDAVNGGAVAGAITGASIGLWLGPVGMTAGAIAGAAAGAGMANAAVKAGEEEGTNLVPGAQEPEDGPPPERPSGTGS